MKTRIILLFIALGLYSCNDGDLSKYDKIIDSPFESDYKVSDLSVSDLFVSLPKSKGQSSLVEASGLAFSRNNAGFVWSIEDKGNDNNIFLIDIQTGATVATYTIKGTKNRDWEDIEISLGPESGKNYLYISDTGDNDLQYEDYTIYRFEEPVFEEGHRSKITKIDPIVVKIVFDYGGKNKDVEALIVDPQTKDIFLVTKRDIYSQLYSLSYPQYLNKTMTATLEGTFPFRITTAASVSADGTEIIIKTYDRVFFWKGKPNQSLISIISSVPTLAPYQKEVQGEAICFDNQGGYFTLSEKGQGIVPELNYYRRKQP